MSGKPRGCAQQVRPDKKASPMKDARAVRDLASLVDMDNTGAVLTEALLLVRQIYPERDLSRIEKTARDTFRLYNGQYPGFRACNIGYHDLKHTTDVFLAMARLLHGICLVEGPLPFETHELSLIASLLHDTGYIQDSHDTEGTGAKYTSTHVERSIAFTRDYFEDNGYSCEEAESAVRIILATDLSLNIRHIPFMTELEIRMGKALFAADLLGQIADRTYLEKLLYLYREFDEGGVPGYKDENDLLEKTTGFYDFIMARLDGEMGYDSLYMSRHFLERWGLKDDLYRKAMDHNICYLSHLIANHKNRYREMLDRGGLIRKLSLQENT